jgi:hypothetical protein
MAEDLFSVPVVFIIFSRPEVTLRTFSEIARIKPKKLLVVGDGPRKGMPREDKRVLEARNIISRVDWNCEVVTNFSEENLGCKRRVSTGLDWVFSLVNEAIILEDDCLPNRSFFIFCQEMLEKYRGYPEIGMISGANFQKGNRRGDSDYYFSKYMHIWGWATWSDRWQNSYDVDMRSWPSFRKSRDFLEVTKSPSNKRYWEAIFEKVYRGKIDTWDYQWLFANWLHKRCSIIPNSNLISNIGFGAGATHTKIKSEISNLPVQELAFPLKHPNSIVISVTADQFMERNEYATGIATFIKKVIKRLQWIFR